MGASGSKMTSKILSSKELRPLAIALKRLRNHIGKVCWGALIGAITGVHADLGWRDKHSMGNATNRLEEHVDQAGKTGVCSLKDYKLTEVRTRTP